jgi:hypothetical protein
MVVSSLSPTGVMLKIVYVYEIEIEISLLTKSGPQEGIYK